MVKGLWELAGPTFLFFESNLALASTEVNFMDFGSSFFFLGSELFLFFLMIISDFYTFIILYMCVFMSSHFQLQ